MHKGFIRIRSASNLSIERKFSFQESRRAKDPRRGGGVRVQGSNLSSEALVCLRFFNRSRPLPDRKRQRIHISPWLRLRGRVIFLSLCVIIIIMGNLKEIQPRPLFTTAHMGLLVMAGYQIYRNAGQVCFINSQCSFIIHAFQN